MSRKLIATAAILIAIQIAGFLLFGPSRAGLLISNSLQLASNGLATVYCFVASRRSRSIARSFWVLSASAFAIWTAANVGWIYSEDWLRVQVPAPSLIYFMFVAYGAPLGMALFLDEEKGGSGIGWQQLLDFLQILILLAFLYFFLYFIPARGAGSQRSQESEFIYVENFENFLLAGAFALRARMSRISHVRRLFGYATLYLLVYATGSAITNYAEIYTKATPGIWYDLTWSVPFLLAACLASGWRQPEQDEVQTSIRIPPRARLLLINLSPVLIPLAVMLLAVQMAERQRAVAYLALGATLLCYGMRLALTQQRLGESEQRYRSLFEHNLAGVFRTTPEGEFLDCNEAFARIFGYAREEMLARNANVLYSNPPVREKRLDRLRRERSFRNLELALQRRDGTTVWVLQNVTLMQDNDGREFIEGTLVDITERKQAEKLLRKQSAAIEGSIDGIAILSEAGEYLYLNSAYTRIFGYSSPAGLFGKSWRALYPEDETARFEREVFPALTKLGKWSGEVNAKKADGTGFPQELALTSLPDGGLVCVCRDITERKKVEAQLRQSQKMEAVGKLAGGVAHDFNNLLTVIRGYNSLLMEKLRKDHELDTSFEQIEKAADRATSLTQQLLAFSRQQVLQPRVINLNAIVHNMDKMLRPLIGEHIEIITVAAPDLGSVKADPSQIEQVIVNLIVNARDAMPHGGKITLETRNVELDEAYVRGQAGAHPGPHILLAVSDNGSGMDAETQTRIFEPFFTTKELSKGTGLGLSTVYGIVKQSEGHIVVYSELGRGSTFKVYLPRIDALPEPVESEDALTHAKRGSETILLVEDEPAVRDLACTILKKRGYSVLLAAAASEAEDLCKQHAGKIHLLLTDLIMPGISGRELAKRLTAVRPGMKVLFMSGYTDEAIVNHGVLERGAAFLQKPFTPNSLEQRIRKLLDQPRPAAVP